MIEVFARKLVVVVPPAAAVNGATVTVPTPLDLRGCDYAAISVIFGATAIAVTVMKLQECETSNGAFVDVVGSRYGTDTNDAGVLSTLPAATANLNYGWLFQRESRMRYINPVITVGVGNDFITVIAELWRLKETPRTAVLAGYAERMVF
jgi:hypothetical protein